MQTDAGEPVYRKEDVGRNVQLNGLHSDLLRLPSTIALECISLIFSTLQFLWDGISTSSHISLLMREN